MFKEEKSMLKQTKFIYLRYIVQMKRETTVIRVSRRLIAFDEVERKPNFVA